MAETHSGQQKAETEMTVYVDSAFHPYGRMIMCHMFADSREELLAMAEQIGVASKWIQKRGTVYEHFDISKGRREKALARGAVAITRKEVGLLLRARRETPSAILREHGPRSGSFRILQADGQNENPFLPIVGLHGDTR